MFGSEPAGGAVRDDEGRAAAARGGARLRAGPGRAAVPGGRRLGAQLDARPVSRRAATSTPELQPNNADNSRMLPIQTESTSTPYALSNQFAFFTRVDLRVFIRYERN